MTLGVFDRARDLGERGFHAGWNTMGDFEKFILRGNVVDLAVGVIIGAAFNNVVQALVKDIITPLIPGGRHGLASLTYTVPFTGGTLLVGDLINTIISFLIIAAVVYFFVVKPIVALQEGYNRLHPKKPEAPTKRECPFCLSEVPLKATRCAYCTAQLPPADAAAAAQTS
ncbi:MAG: large conductance mechanosensitive channel protein MscL [Ktedonobacteraceae bacterium]|nr:large conductance mechanosensitive channel protein MscL [Ktedonobacteraceae bacterium]MBV9616909.1 large conductance mechanosensitive channel protein MscL [Ktedonobacteraceae bacterium]